MTLSSIATAGWLAAVAERSSCTSCGATDGNSSSIRIAAETRARSSSVTANPASMAAATTLAEGLLTTTRQCLPALVNASIIASR